VALNLEEALSNTDGLVMIDQDTELQYLPEPAPQDLWCPVISVDDHAFEPSTLFDRVPAHLRDQAPRVVQDGWRPMWQIGEKKFPMVGVDGAAGRPDTETRVVGMRLEQFRTGVYDLDARVADMNMNGVWASLNFPSTLWGFAGTRLNKLPTQELALACIRSYNDWMLEDWCGSYPDRFIPCQLPFLADVEIAAQEIYRNADRGIHSVSFSENPYGLGYPSIHSGHWDPFLKACAETGTVVNLHVGSSGSLHQASPDAPSIATSALFPVNGIEAVLDWIFSKIPIRFPDIKLVLSEAGMSWVPMVQERLDVAYRRRRETSTWTDADPHPRDVLSRNFWFTSIEDPAGFRMLDLIGEDRVMVETDFPHPDGTWPGSQGIFKEQMEHLPVSTIKKICFENAANLYQHPLPNNEFLSKASALSK
jgi:predicted TIM-barrel fold metal-dependent hydrolase